jgi:O-antigen/teichoic acid export membrane protein
MAFFTKTILGSYTFAYRIVTAPVALIGSSIYQVFYQKATLAKQQGEDVQKMVIRIYRNLFLLGLPLFVLLFLFAVPVFRFVFGEDWAMAGEIARIISPWLFLNFIASPVSCITVIVNKQKEGMMLSIGDLILKITAIVIGGLYNDFYLTFILMSILCGSLLILSLYLFYKFAGADAESAY